MGTLAKTYTSYLPLALIGIAFLKLLLTNLYSVRFKRRTFFLSSLPEYIWDSGMATLTCRPDRGEVVFEAKIVTASLLGEL